MDSTSDEATQPVKQSFLEQAAAAAQAAVAAPVGNLQSKSKETVEEPTQKETEVKNEGTTHDFVA